MTTHPIVLVKLICAVSLFAVIAGCSSQPPAPSDYYLLNTLSKPSDRIPPRLTLQLSQLKLPDYLQQPAIVMQRDSQQLHYARYAMWAEPLQSSIEKVLIDELASLGLGLLPSDIDGRKGQQLSLQIDHFYPTSRATVVLAGHFKTSATSASVESEVSKFYLEEPLNADGFGPAVGQMRALLAQLAVKISEHPTLSKNISD